MTFADVLRRKRTQPLATAGDIYGEAVWTARDLARWIGEYEGWDIPASELTNLGARVEGML